MPNLDRRITVQSATEVRDAAGQPIETWADFAANLPAEYLPVSGGEQFEAQQRLATRRSRFRIRYRTDITRKMRLQYAGEDWNIRDVEEDRRFDRRQYSIITAEVIAAT